MWMPIDFPGPVWLDWILTVSTVATALVAIGVFIRKGWPVLGAFINTVNALSELPKFVEDSAAFRAKVEADILTIKKEILPNGGASLADRSLRAEETLDHIKRQLMAVKTTQARTSTQVTALTARFADHLEIADETMTQLRNSGALPKEDKL